MADKTALFKQALSAPFTYVVTLVLIGFALFGAFALKTIPSFVGYTGVATGILALIAFLMQDLTSESTPTGWPSWSTFIVVLVVGGLEALYGQVTSQTFLTLAGSLGALLFVVQYAVNYLNQDQGTNIPLATEMQVVALLGIVVTILTGFLNGVPNATTIGTGLTVTTFASLGGWLFGKEQANAKARAQRAKPPGAAPT